LRYNQAWMLLCLMAVSATILFRVHPWFDLTISSIFLDDFGRFAGNADGVWWWVRNVQITLSAGLILFAMLALALALRGRSKASRLPASYWAFVLLLYAIGPGLLVYGLFKRFSGRARPVFIEEFGGDRSFSAAWSFSDQCLSNCSFVSAEAASASALAISAVIASRIDRSRVARLVSLFCILLLPLVMLQRIGSGRHFLSDTIFAFLIVAGVALILIRLFLPRSQQLATASDQWETVRR
jgi:lipid A 4'-phosphatase